MKRGCISLKVKIEMFDYIQQKVVKVSQSVYDRYKGNTEKIAEMRLKDRNRHRKNAVKTETINKAIKQKDVAGLQRFEKNRRNKPKPNIVKPVRKQSDNAFYNNLMDLLEKAISLGYNYNADTWTYDSEQLNELETFLHDRELEMYEFDEDDYDILEEDYYEV